MHPIGPMVAAGMLALHHPADSESDDGRVLLRESFEASAGAHLPAGWSSSHTRFPLWPDFVVAGDPPTHDDQTAIAESVSGDAWLMSPPMSPETVVVNEIMYAPRAGEPEWVEILNAGASTVNIGGWTISDASGARSSPFPAIVVPVGGTAVVTRDLQQFTLARGEPQCQAIVLGSMPSLNNGGDAVIVRTMGGVTIDSVSYTPSRGGAAGKSLERRHPRSPPDGENWGECADSSGATPCAVNSIAVLPVDVSLSLRAGYRIPHGAVALLDAILSNSGSEPLQDIEVRWLIDADRDAVPDEDEEFASRREDVPLLPGDSRVVTAEWTGAHPGVHQLIVRGEQATQPAVSQAVERGAGIIEKRHLKLKD